MSGPSPSPAILRLLTALRCTSQAQLAGNLTHATYAPTSIPSPANLGSQFAEVGMLDALATLCSMHSLCESAAVSLEVSPESLCVIISTADQSHPEVRRFIEDCCHHVQLLAETYEAHRLRGPDRGDIHKDTDYTAIWRAFAIMVHKQCYSKFRQYLRSADFETMMRKMDEPEGLLSPYTRHEERVEFWRLADEINNAAQCLVTTTEPEQEEDEMYHWALYLLGNCIYRRSFDSALGKRLNRVFGSGTTRKHPQYVDMLLAEVG
ncbi:hypothetical protein K466DRAFT_649691 [Polyporus arcularius HHB13444]|uniref:Uncharacterized protein n=1 Tax=Polyporus arcularius HHB13444 TaxID=1314778 RepID=A0A5C3Q6A4_9APHY|nr:hypothetical protein K466DRAFT_649691 [Polyporus arcularius HHB13444]